MLFYILQSLEWWDVWLQRAWRGVPGDRSAREAQESRRFGKVYGVYHKCKEQTYDKTESSKMYISVEVKAELCYGIYHKYP